MNGLRKPGCAVAMALSFATAGCGQEKETAPPAATEVEVDLEFDEAGEFPPSMPKIELRDGDVFVFLGDSITHQCLHTQFVETYHYARYPGRRIRFHNAGVSGDRAAHALSRFDEDVARWQPGYVSILLGMNDGRYRSFDRPTFDTYREDMTEALDSLPAGGRGVRAQGGTVSDAAPDGLSFTFRADVLPWVLPAEARAGYSLARAGSRHSAELLAVRGLQPGEYRVAIDDAVVGSYSDVRLARGVELQENEKTPQYRQALAVAEANARRNRECVRPIRGWWLQRKVLETGILEWDLQDSDEARAAAERLRSDLDAWLENEFSPGIAALQEAADAQVEEIYSINQPAPRRYRIESARVSHDDGKTGE